MKDYLIEVEISGPTALWSRPDTMPNPVSYVAPTFSAAKGIFESVVLWKSVNVRPLKCEICAPVQFHRYAFNYGGPLRKSKSDKWVYLTTRESLFFHRDSRHKRATVCPSN